MTILSRVNRINSELTAENVRLRHDLKVMFEDNMKWRHEAGKLFGELSRLKHRMAIIADAEEAAE